MISATGVTAPILTRPTPAYSYQAYSVTQPNQPVAPVPPSPPYLVTQPPMPPPLPVDTIPIGPGEQPAPEQPGAGPHITMSPNLPGGPFDIFSADSFRWWKPVLIATGLALFGGTVLAIFRTRR